MSIPWTCEKFKALIASIVIVALTGCGSGGSDRGDSAAPSVPAATVPKLSATPIDLGLDATIGMPNAWPAGNTAAGGQGTAIAGVNCVSSDAYHVHAHLAIIKDGQVLAIPQNIGLLPTCTYPLHTHNATGVIHIEAPAPTRFTLGQFFAVWGQPLSYSNVAGLTGLPIVVYVEDGGAVRQYTGDLADLELSMHRSITIQVGSQLAEIPSYTWTQGL